MPPSRSTTGRCSRPTATRRGPRRSRGEVEYRYLGALDLVAADAAARGSRQEALTALEAAARHDPGDPVRAALIAEQLQKLGRERSARYVADRTERPGA